MAYVNSYHRLIPNYIGGEYFQYNKTCKCVRNTDIAVYNSLAILDIVEGNHYIKRVGL